MSPCCNLDLENNKPKVLHDILAHDDASKYQVWNKIWGGSEAIIWTNIDILTLHCDLDLECSNSIFSQDTLAYDDVSSDQVWLPRNQQFRKYSRKSHILIIWALTVTLTLKIATTTKTFPHDSGSWCCITIPKLWQNVLWFRIAIPNLVTKCSVIQKISSGQTFTDILNLCCDLDLKRSNPIFTRTLQLMILYYQTMFGCKPTSSL